MFAKRASRYAERMTGSRFLLCFLLAIMGAPCALATEMVREAVTLTPAVVIAGSPELIRVRAPDAKSVDGEWMGRKILFFADHGRWVALAGVDVEAAVGPSALHITAHTEGKDVDLSRTIDIRPAHYRTAALTVSPKFVEPPPEALKEIDEESQLKAKVYAASAPEPLWHGSFHAPVASAPTDSFG